jgi:tRNA-Thr(GGU) m(6)t(6)A37 methyltransferase TsaA
MIMLDPIGTVHTPFDSPSEAPSQGFLDDSEGRIELRTPLEHATAGLEAGQLVDVVWYADRADRGLLRLDGGEKGVFAARSQDRPNPVSITRCEVRGVEGTTIRIAGVDMVDGTPVIDVKAAFDGRRGEPPQAGRSERRNAADLD